MHSVHLRAKFRLEPFILLPSGGEKPQFCIFWTTVCKTGRPMLSDGCPVCPVCLSVLPVTFVHCDQTVVRIKMKLGTQLGLGPGHIVLDGDPAPLPQRGTAPPSDG